MNALDRKILTCFDQKKYSTLALNSRQIYANNSPFPHIVFDNFLPNDVAHAVAREYPDVREMESRWKLHKNENVNRLFLEDVTQFSDRQRLFADAIVSRSFLLFLETLTGIQALIPDPYFMGGGAMVTGTGGFLNVHVDFNWHQKLQCWRRCNALFYLTPQWQEDWQGSLELWTTDGQRKVKSVAPIFNRLVVFSTTRESYHGQPSKLQCPQDIYRRVFSAFYYASTRSENIDEQPHYTRYNLKNNSLLADKNSSPYAEEITNQYLQSADRNSGDAPLPKIK